MQQSILVLLLFCCIYLFNLHKGADLTYGGLILCFYTYLVIK